MKGRSAKRHKVCNSCGAENALNASACKICEKKKFAPLWVQAKRAVNRQVSVEITTSNQKYGTPEPRLTLSKWWPGGRATFHIPNADQWGKIERIINQDLMPIIGWKPAKDIVQTIKAKEKKGKDKMDLKEQAVIAV